MGGTTSRTTVDRDPNKQGGLLYNLFTQLPATQSAYRAFNGATSTPEIMANLMANKDTDVDPLVRLFPLDRWLPVKGALSILADKADLEQKRQRERKRKQDERNKKKLEQRKEKNGQQNVQTKVYLTCSSSQKNYTFAFDYINAKYVKAMFSDSKVLTWGTDYVVNGHTLTLTKEPTNGELLIIYRETPTDKTVEWYDSSILRAKDMNLFNTQLLHVNEENTDRLADSGIQEDKIDGRWDAREKSIKNLKAPTENSEAVNLGFLKKTQESYLNASQAKVNEATTQAQLATNQANNAKEYARQAKASADAASMSQVQASTKASEAQANASSASNSASNASTSADNASASETNAFNSERTAKGHEDKTREYMGTTLSYKLDAGQSATNANNSMIQSATYAEEAKKYRDEAKAIAGKDFVTNEAFESYKQSVPNSIQAKVDSHNESPDAHHQLFQDVNQN